eukprot:4413997-Alexandrium_andersonii.AAC.1
MATVTQPSSECSPSASGGDRAIAAPPAMASSPICLDEPSKLTRGPPDAANCPKPPGSSTVTSRLGSRPTTEEGRAKEAQRSK